MAFCGLRSAVAVCLLSVLRFPVIGFGVFGFRFFSSCVSRFLVLAGLRCLVIGDRFSLRATYAHCALCDYLASGELSPFHQGLHRLANLGLKGGQQRRRVDRLRRPLRLGDDIAQRLHATTKEEQGSNKTKYNDKHSTRTGTKSRTQHTTTHTRNARQDATDAQVSTTPRTCPPSRQEVCFPVYSPTLLPVCLSVGATFCLSLHLTDYTLVRATVLSIRMFACLPAGLPVCLSACLSVGQYF